MLPILEDIALTAVEDVALVSGLPFKSNGLVAAALVGGVGGLLVNDRQNAALAGALGGFLIGIGHRGHSMGSIAMATVTSTAMGLVTQLAKESYLQRETHRSHSPNTSHAPQQGHR